MCSCVALRTPKTVHHSTQATVHGTGPQADRSTDPFEGPAEADARIDEKPAVLIDLGQSSLQGFERLIDLNVLAAMLPFRWG